MKALRLGSWIGTFRATSEWWREKRAGGEHSRSEAMTTPSKVSGYNIQGKTSAGGARIFHLRGSRNYERTRIKHRAREHIFCSEGEAMLAVRRALRG